MKALAALLVIGMAVPAMAAQEGDSAKPAKPRMICKRDPASQTRLGTRVCRPAAEKPSKSARTAPTTTTPKPATKVPAETFAASAGAAPAPVQVASEATVTAEQPKEKKICKRQASSVSRLGAGPRICKTVAEWRRSGQSIPDDSEKLQMNEGKGR
jgi:hypothetical protein